MTCIIHYITYTLLIDYKIILYILLNYLDISHYIPHTLVHYAHFSLSLSTIIYIIYINTGNTGSHSFAKDQKFKFIQLTYNKTKMMYLSSLLRTFLFCVCIYHVSTLSVSVSFKFNHSFNR